MAEVVQEHLESMILELEELEDNDVFSKEEIKMIIKKRKDFEYKVQRKVEKTDILNYLEYELKLNKLRIKRTKKLKLKPYSNASLSVSRRIHILFKKALMKFGDDMKLWIEYIHFCRKTGSERAMAIAFGQLLQKHANNPEVWLLAANYEFEVAKNVDNARLLIQRGLRVNKESQKLWHECFRLELLHVDKIKKRRKLLGVDGIELKDEDAKEQEPKMLEDFLENKTAEVVFNNATKQFPDCVSFWLRFLYICESFQENESLISHIYKSVKDAFPNDERTHSAFACRPIRTLQVKDKQELVQENEWIDAEQSCQQEFQQAVQSFDTSVMWQLYIETFVGLLNESKTQKQAERRLNQVLVALESTNEKLTEPFYLLWSHLLVEMGDESKAMVILTNALESDNQSVGLWMKFLLLKCKQESDWSLLKKDFDQCLTTCTGDTAGLWQMYIDVAMATETEDIENIVQKCLRSCPGNKDPFLEQYLTWIDKTRSVCEVRAFVNRMRKEYFSKKFLTQCIRMERTRVSPDISYLRTLYEQLIDRHGKLASDVWLGFIEFETCTNSLDIERIGAIYNRAKRTLDDRLVSEFMSEYALLGTS